MQIDQHRHVINQVRHFATVSLGQDEAESSLAVRLSVLPQLGQNFETTADALSCYSGVLKD
jgi:hypothetical protein